MTKMGHKWIKYPLSEEEGQSAKELKLYLKMKKKLSI